ncbi:DUF4142 domain-containing protein [Dactylosporangium salmoneum]|uniref:DUF4142 domain-containing protein n=1 Tax=Dactylosporangium salmoneum TaxID=53361 RepID=A0ABP5UAY2_9ACTN
MRAALKVGTLATALLVTVPPMAAHAAPTPASAQDRAFVEDAGRAGAYEIAGGRLAATRAADPRLRAFGIRMVTDHTQGAAALADLAAALGLDVPSRPDATQRTILDVWGSVRGPAFDCSYAPAAYADHVAAIGAFEREAADGRNPALRQFASDTLPTLREHRADAARNLRGLDCATPMPLPIPIPTSRPTPRPTVTPTARPTVSPTARPTVRPTLLPTALPTTLPTFWPLPRPSGS